MAPKETLTRRVELQIRLPGAGRSDVKVPFVRSGQLLQAATKRRKTAIDGINPHFMYSVKRRYSKQSTRMVMASINASRMLCLRGLDLNYSNIMFISVGAR
jgi:hypothetical protein